MYRARDTRLDRIVAVKVPPARVSSNPQSPEHFEREAEAISSLAICQLYDGGYHGGVDFLVREYLEGETLAHRPKNAGSSVEGR